MYKKLTFFLIVILIFTSLNVFASQFVDINKSDWYYGNLLRLYPLNIVQGNGNKEFMPTNTIKYNEFLKMVVVALNKRTYHGFDMEWDMPYIVQAYILGVIPNTTYNNYRNEITRYEMASVIAAACKEDYDDYEKYKSYIKDFDIIPEEYKENVLKAYSKGLITGYEDKTFGGERTMRRSEAIAVIARLIDKELRVEPGELAKEEPIPLLADGRPVRTFNIPEIQWIYDNVSGMEPVIYEDGKYKPDTIGLLYREDDRAITLNSMSGSDIIFSYNKGNEYVPEYFALTLRTPYEQTHLKAYEIIKLFYPTSHKEIYQAASECIGFNGDKIKSGTVLDKDNHKRFTFSEYRDGRGITVFGDGTPMVYLRMGRVKE